ncbi:phosphofructokinase, putative [Medicago truncatula]|uniref:Phosphofructokinase, putative n=1 Tax=Medicago truncatula TaxID=3880 RepID=G7JUY2_MEDTR|nr:phosphofructokinase, putative [Medicago truncatula]
MCNDNFSGQNFDMLMLQVIQVMRQLKIPLAGPIDSISDLTGSFHKSEGAGHNFQIYIDPTYIIRVVPSNASGSVYYTLLTVSVVHGAMAGYIGHQLYKSTCQ